MKDKSRCKNYLARSSNGLGYHTFYVMIPVRIRYGLQRFVGVMANITDCRSVVTGSIPVRTAHIAAFQLVGYSVWNGEDAGSSPACYTCLTPKSKGPMPDGVIGNTSDFDSDILSSNLSPVTYNWLIVQRTRTLCYEYRDESSNLSKPTIVMMLLSQKYLKKSGCVFCSGNNNGS